MTEPTDSSPAQRAAHLAAFGLLYGLAALLARTVLAGPAGGLANADPSYYAGATVALPFDVLLGCVIGLPAARRPGSLGARAVSGVCAMVVLALHVAVTPRLPGAVTREHLELAGPRALGAGLMLGAALLAGLQPLAQRLTARYEKRAGRVADAEADAIVCTGPPFLYDMVMCGGAAFAPSLGNLVFHTARGADYDRLGLPVWDGGMLLFEDGTWSQRRVTAQRPAKP